VGQDLLDVGVGDFQAVPGLGPVKSRALLAVGVTSVGEPAVHDLLNAGVKIKERTVGVLTGLTFCFTGASKMKRDDLIALVAEHGGTVKSSVTKGLSYLVMADANSTTTKAQAARKNGTKCLSEDDFLKMVRP
jgi:DNA ligase (NAD+)